MSDLHCPIWGMKKSRASGHSSDRRGYASQKFEHERDSSGVYGASPRTGPVKRIYHSLAQQVLLMNGRLQLCQKELLRDSKQSKDPI